MHGFMNIKWHLSIKLILYMPRRRHIKFGQRRITQQKTYNIQNTAKVWNQEHLQSVWKPECYVYYYINYTYSV